MEKKSNRRDFGRALGAAANAPAIPNCLNAAEDTIAERRITRPPNFIGIFRDDLGCVGRKRKEPAPARLGTRQKATAEAPT